MRRMSKTCKTCKYWNQNTNYEYVANLGECSELKTSDKVSINLSLGWDGGYVDSIEIEEDFGCNQWKEITDDKVTS